jgi:SAM-dependent methyltransferase
MILSFDDLAAHFDAQRGLPAAALREWTGAVNLFAAGRTLRVIEPGIGTGRITLPLAVAGHKVTGIDVSEAMLEACARKVEALNVADRVTLIHGDATSLPSDDDAFNVGVMASLLYLMPEWEALLDELARVVTPGGAIVHLIERTEAGNDLQLWDIAWRKRIEEMGYIHPVLRPSVDEVRTEFSRRWPDTRIEALASWGFGQTVGEGRHRFSERLRRLYADVAQDDWDRVVGGFLGWSERTFPDPETRLDGQVILEAMIARV